MNIVIVTSGHKPLDERIFYKLGLSLKKYEHDVAIICSTENIETVIDGINIKGFEGNALTKKDKIKQLFNALTSFSPSLIICCEPLTILAAYKYKKEKSKHIKIISDITEYYPHKNMLDQYSGLFRILSYLRYFLFNLYVTNLADYLFIGETGKAKLYHFIAPTIRKTIIGYYPPLRFFDYSPPVYDGRYFTLCYSGIISVARGFPRYIMLLKLAAERFPDKIFIAKVIGRYEQPELKNLLDGLLSLKNIRIIYNEWVSYKKFSDAFSDVDVCIDLRDKNSVFNRSLPIKVFDYIACGKPVIYSNLSSFKEYKDIKNIGLLVEPDDLDTVLERIEFYLNSPESLKEDSLIARKLFEDKYNWESVEQKIIHIINSLY